MEGENQLIKITQLPVIEEHLRGLKEQVERETAEAMSLVCNEDTIQTVKAKRAELNKMFTELEAQRKPVKAAILAPYEHFEAIYKECVTELFKRADADLKGKIDETENEIKSRCEKRLREYFDELCAVEGLDFLTFEQAGVKVDMASSKQKTPKKLMDQLKAFVDNAAADVKAISAMENAAEIMVEYKNGFTLANAVSLVNLRYERIAAEKAEQESRKGREERAEEAVSKVEAVAPPTIAEAPKEAEKPLKCSFTVYGTKDQLMKLKRFMIQEGIRYE